MELKTKYQYTYFIYPFLVKENKYKKYILKLVKDKKCNLKIFEKEKDLKLYEYFSPKIREFLFSSFSFSYAKKKKMQELPVETRAAILSNYPCTIFEYDLPKDVQGKTGEKDGIFFNIQKVEIICFSNGICFLCMKTNIEDVQDFRDVLNFNYKFRSSNQEYGKLMKYDNIRLQTSKFSDIQTFSEWIRNITGSKIEAMRINEDTENFLTYSYLCISSEDWNQEKSFSSIMHSFVKYANILPADSNLNIEEDSLEVFSKWKYCKIGMTKQGIMLLSSQADMSNYTTIPEKFEREYFYTYILCLYKKIYLKKIREEFKGLSKNKKVRKEFLEFTKKIWIQDISQDEAGFVYHAKIQKVLGLDILYAEVKNQYDIAYKEVYLKRNKKIIITLIIIIIFILLINLFYILGNNLKEITS